jgi:hypothetical protein
VSGPTEKQSTPSLREFVESKVDKRLVGVRVALPARVTSYDAKRQCVDAAPEIGQAYFEGGERIPEDLPIVTDVPVMFPGSGSFRVTFPIAVGDIVLLVFASSSIARWKVTGKGGDPGDDRHHRLSDAIAIPGLISLASRPTDAPTDAVVVHAPKIKLGSSDSNHKVLTTADGSLFLTALAYAISQLTTPADVPGLHALIALYSALTQGGTPPTPSVPDPWPKGSDVVSADTGDPLDPP